MSLSTAELAAMRDTADDYLPDTCTINRPSAPHGTSGAPKKSFSALATNVPCRMDEPIAAAAETIVNSAIGVVVRWPMHFKYDQDITVKDRVVFGGNTYEVAEVLDSASWLITRRVVVVRVE